MRLFVLLALVAVLLAGCGGSDGGSDLFSYDDSEPADLVDNGRVNRDYPIAVHDVTYEGPNGQVPALLAVPPGEGPFPAVIFLHGAGQTRESMLLPATWMAGRGAVALSVTSPFSRPEGQTSTGGLEGLRSERQLTVQTVQELRRAIDVLQARPEVDAERIGFLGFSAGARQGAILAGVEPRIRAYVLWSGGASPIEEYLANVPEEEADEIRSLLEDVDPLAYVGDAAPSELYFQYGTDDEVVPQDALAGLYEAASDPKERTTYDSGHELPEKAQADGLDWLAEKLEITGPPVEGAVTGPS